ncbi:nucleotidyltransferase family protein [Microbacterium mangrovi]|uniref:hypothetical protein n=1 Tax=Microbacterium mangrovi TaxID=1348253 RepID=UPI000690DD48|nr:hypothetical protein [Microbacterium mangrovi]
MTESGAMVPLSARIEIGRASVQTVADECTADILHIKGDAVDPSLGLTGASGTDIDLIVRPAHVARLHGALERHGWVVYSTFRGGSPFGHAQTYHHELWGYLDVHRFFPGIETRPDAGFAVLWVDRTTGTFAGLPASVPSLTAQRLIALLNSARSPRPDVVERLWADASAEDRTAVTELADALDARVALAAATGDLERFRDRRSYLLWNVLQTGGPRTVEWRARVRAAPTRRERVQILLRAPQVNVEHLAHRLGRAPTRWEITREFFARPATAVREALHGRGRRS